MFAVYVGVCRVGGMCVCVCILPAQLVVTGGAGFVLETKIYPCIHTKT